MRQALAALAVASALAATPATADYDSCMTHCMSQHEFDHCHPTCSDTFSASGETTGTVPQPDRVCTLSRDERDNVVWAWIKENYGDVDAGWISYKDDPNLFRVSIEALDDEGHYYEGTIKITGDCEVGLHELEYLEYSD